jgi:hypothetical protein
MVGLAGIIFVFLPESPWWLVGKDRHEKASKVLHLCNGRVQGYDVQEQIVWFSLDLCNRPAYANWQNRG